jgi:hypothetical protein
MGRFRRVPLVGRKRLREKSSATITLHQLGDELGHGDCGRAIYRFLRQPDDGRGPFSKHRIFVPLRLTPEQADRVRDRFS